MRATLLGLTALVSALAAAACTSQSKETRFVDHFDGSGFPNNGWAFAGATPVLDTTAGDPAPAMTWTACSGSGSIAQINETFDARYTLDAAVNYAVYGSGAGPSTAVVFHLFGDLGDDAYAAVEPPPAGKVQFELDGGVIAGALPTGPGFHRLELGVNGYGQAVWTLDGSAVAAYPALNSGFWAAGIICAGPSTPGRVPVLIDNLSIDARNSP